MSIIEINNLGKKYSIAGERGAYLALRDIVAKPWSIFTRGKDKKPFWALKNVSFSVEKGEVIGIIGPNGAGKSTLLKILSQITPPTEGSVRIDGRVGSLLEVGTGFHPELTGRDNIYLNGSILGMSRKEIEEKFDDIVAFAGIEQFLDTPIKRYSSGMSVRLAFAVAAHLEPEILIIDEVLAVGDAEFQKKCLGKMEEITSKEGRTILLVSHNMGAIQSLCKRSVVLNHGEVVFMGETNKAIDVYLGSNKEFFDLPLSERTDRTGAGPLRFANMEIIPVSGEDYLSTGEKFSVAFDVSIDPDHEDLKNVAISFSINDQINGKHLLVFWTETTGNLDIKKGQHRIVCDVERCPLVSGQYVLNVYATVGGVVSDYVVNAAKVLVDDTKYFKGPRDHEAHPKYVVDHAWKVE